MKEDNLAKARAMSSSIAPKQVRGNTSLRVETSARNVFLRHRTISALQPVVSHVSSQTRVLIVSMPGQDA